MNLYSYAGNNPISFRDPFGLKDCTKNPAQCEIMTLKLSIGLLPASAQAKEPIFGGVKAEFGPKASVFGELTFATDGVYYDWGTEGGGEASLSAGSLKVGGSCSANPGSGALACGGSGSVTTRSKDAKGSTSTGGDVGGEFGGGVVKVGATVKLANVLKAAVEPLVQALRDAYHDFKETFRVVQQASSPTSP